MSCNCKVCKRNYGNTRNNKPYVVTYSFMGNRGKRIVGDYYTYYLSDVFGFAAFVRRMLGEVSCDISSNRSESEV